MHTCAHAHACTCNHTQYRHSLITTQLSRFQALLSYEELLPMRCFKNFVVAVVAILRIEPKASWMLGKGSPTTEHRCSYSHHHCHHHHHHHQSCPSAILYPHEVRVLVTAPIFSYSLPSPVCIPSSLLVLSSDSSPFFQKHLRPSLTVVLNSLCHQAVIEFSIFLPPPPKQWGLQANSNTPGPQRLLWLRNVLLLLLFPEQPQVTMNHLSGFSSHSSVSLWLDRRHSL